jgi:hypothetical protein
VSTFVGSPDFAFASSTFLFVEVLYVDRQGCVCVTTPKAADLLWKLFQEYASTGHGQSKMQSKLTTLLGQLCDKGYAGRGPVFESYFLLKLTIVGSFVLRHSDLLGNNVEDIHLTIQCRRQMPVDAGVNDWKDLPAQTLVFHPGHGEERVDFIFFNQNTVYFFELTTGDYVSTKVPLLNPESSETRDRVEWICAVVKKWIGPDHYDVKINNGKLEATRTTTKPATRQQSARIPPKIKYIVVSTAVKALAINEGRANKYPFVRLACLPQLAESGLFTKEQIRAIGHGVLRYEVSSGGAGLLGRD